MGGIRVSKAEKSSDKDMEILSVLSAEHESRHSTFWALTYKAVFAVTTILSLPYFLYEKIQSRILLSLFSFFAALICIFAGCLLKMESQRMSIVRKKRDEIIYRNSQETRRINDEFNNRMKDKEKVGRLSRFLWKNSISNMIWIVFLILWSICIAEGVLILTSDLFSAVP